ncbi:hypothetical protein [Streptomyces sp. NBC_01477]|uniref:hypothetical protein n=1 Tax=Streptomyces sp. NBC_01477 TaxID=2976015 RepID=UPI002E315250|nr:hypothetical protein [Streptomyces sp. NBC_01477]
MTAPTTREWLQEAARRISRGVPVLAGQIVRHGAKAARTRAARTRTGIRAWLGESTSQVDTVLRWVMLAGAGWAAWTIGKITLGAGSHAVTGARWLMWPAAVTLTVAAYRAGGKAPAADVQEEPEEESGEPTSPTEPEPDDADRLTVAIHDAARGGNVHLTAIAAKLAADTGRQWDVLALCRTHGIRTRPVRVPDADPAVTTGIHRMDLPPLPHPLSAPPVRVVAAGQADNNNTNRPSVESIGEGAAVIVKAGPAIRQGVRR